MAKKDSIDMTSTSCMRVVLTALVCIIIWQLPVQASDLPVKVDYSRTVEQMVADGKYDWSHPDIAAKNFRIHSQRKVELTIKLINFNRNMTSKEVLRELDKQGLRPATLPELLAFAARYPDKQREFPIVALGSVWRSFGGRRDVPYLWSRSSGRGLGLSWLDRRWSILCHFAAVRK